MSILVTGGAGYIGSATVELLCERGERVIVLDDLARGHRGAVPAEVPFYHGEIGDEDLVRRVVREHGVESCIHFAALAYVGESVEDPARYFRNNVAQGIRLLDALLAEGVKLVVFSSTCATYGEPVKVPIPEDHPQQPTNPYGWSKLMMEQIMRAYDRAYGFRFVALRYFNAAGATRRCGEVHDPETHLIPNVLAAAEGQLPCVAVYGNDYPTPDGTCIRDYIHVADLGEAHILALDYLRRGGASDAFNLGNGQGYSVLEVIETARRVTGKRIEVRFEGRRPGDPSRLVADATRARTVLGWRPRYGDLETIIRTAYEWMRAHPRGYAEN